MQQKERHQILYRNTQERRFRNSQYNDKGAETNNKNFQYVSPENTIKIGALKGSTEYSPKARNQVDCNNMPKQQNFQIPEEDIDNGNRDMIESQQFLVQGGYRQNKLIEQQPNYIQPQPPIIYRNVSKQKPRNMDFQRICESKMFRQVHRNRHSSIGKNPSDINHKNFHNFIQTPKIHHVSQQFLQEENETISNIIEQLKTSNWQKSIVSELQKWLLFENPDLLDLVDHYRNLTLGIMVDYHRTMKLPIQAFYIAINIFDRVTSKNLQEAIQNFQNQNNRAPDIPFFQSLFLRFQAMLSLENMAILGAACLYTSHKLEKYKLYKINSWAKQFNADNVFLLPQALPQFCAHNFAPDTPQFQQQRQEKKQFMIKRILALQAMILITLNFNPWKPHLYDNFLTMCSCIQNREYRNMQQTTKTQTVSSINAYLSQYSIKTPTYKKSSEHRSRKYISSQQQFYFCLYLLELSQFCNFNRILHHSHLQSKEQTEISLIDVSLAILQVSIHLFSKNSNVSVSSPSKNQQTQTSSKQKMQKLIQSIYQCENKNFPINSPTTTAENSQILSQYESPIQMLQNKDNSLNGSYLRHKTQLIKKISNTLFKLLLIADKPPFLMAITRKYGKYTNLAVSKIKFVKENKINLFNTVKKISKQDKVEGDPSKQTPKQEQIIKQAERTSDSKPRVSIENKRPAIILSQIDSTRGRNCFERNQSRVVNRSVIKR